MNNLKISFLILTMLIVRGFSENTTIARITIRNQHQLSNYWPYLSIFGFIGSFLNGFVFYVLIAERDSLTTSVNIMLWYEETLKSWNISKFVRAKSFFWTDRSLTRSWHISAHIYCHYLLWLLTRISSYFTNLETQLKIIYPGRVGRDENQEQELLSS